MEPFLRGHQASSVARKMSTSLSHQSTQTINHPLPTPRRGRAVGEPLLTEPLPRVRRKLLGPSWAAKFSREVTGYSDNRWTSQIGHQALSLSPSCLVSGLEGGLLKAGTQPLCSGNGAEVPEFQVK